jgi:hypothetical protein
MQTLAMSGVPWYYCKETASYRVRPGFRFSAFDVPPTSSSPSKQADETAILEAVQRLVNEGEQFLAALRTFCEVFRRRTG